MMYEYAIASAFLDKPPLDKLPLNQAFLILLPLLTSSKDE